MRSICLKPSSTARIGWVILRENSMTVSTPSVRSRMDTKIVRLSTVLVSSYREASSTSMTMRHWA